MSTFWDVTALRTILDSETDYDSPGSEELMSQIRENIEALFLLLFLVESGGTATSDPSNDANGYFYDTAAGWSDDEHNGRTLLITSGNGKGNYYTIDDTVAASDRLACTGDNLYADGVRSGDSYMIFYDLQSSLAHDHDGVNSKSVVLANYAVTTSKIANYAVTEAKLADSAVARAKLKTSTVEITTISASYATQVLTGANSYGFYPQFKRVGAPSGITARLINAIDPTTSYTTQLSMRRDTGTATMYGRCRYVTSSGEVFWMFFLCDKDTKKIISANSAPDHPCFGNGGKPQIIAHPFSDYDPAKHLIVVVNPDKKQLRQIQKRIYIEDEKIADRSLLQVVLEDYELDFSKKPAWPQIPVTVGFDNEEDAMPGSVANIIKKKIPQPSYIRTAALKLKK